MVKFELRPYQIVALEKVHNDLQRSKAVLLQAIMGAGKTVMICRLINRYFFETDRRFLILAHKQELVEQFEHTFRTKTDIPADEIGVMCAGLKRKEFGRVTIGTVQTFVNHAESFGYVNLLVIDEAHRIEIGKGSQYDNIINVLRSHNAELRVIGITATPFRLGHGYIFGENCIGENLFPELNYQIKYDALKKQGYLMPLEGKVAIDDSLPDDMKEVGTSGDYNLDQLGRVMTKHVHLKTAVDAIKDHCGGFHHICVFCCTIDHAEQIRELIGDDCTIVHSKLSDFERANNMEIWKSGRKRIITSVNILVEGFDFPALDCLVMARPTLSTSLYLQAVGRVLRISDGKQRAFLLDLTDNTQRFGTDLDNVVVSIPKKISEKIAKEKRYEKECPECLEICHSARYECSVCGYVFPSVELVAKDSDPTLMDINFNEPVKYKVHSVKYYRHEKAGKPDSIRVEYHNDNPYKSRIAAEWLCFDHGGFAQKKALEWWERNTTDHEIFPDNVDEAIEIIEQYMIVPEFITVVKDGKFERVEELIFDEIPF